MMSSSSTSKTTLEQNTLSTRDRERIWHPFTQEKTAPPPLGITQGQGAWLFDENNNSYLDLISSWWVTLHGHAHPKIAAAIAQQAQKLEQVIFAGFTHEPAVSLCEKLSLFLPEELQRFFFSDNGSTAVEVALKMAYQSFRNQGQHQRTRFLAFEGGYHGDTFGAMAVGNASGYFNSFSDLLFEVDFLPFPQSWDNDLEKDQKEAYCLEKLDMLLETQGENYAAFIFEPLVQGSAGMRMMDPAFLKKILTRIREKGILLIADEIMTGFGRTGTFLACEQVGMTPDLLCLSKGLTGGFLPLSLTVATQALYESFLDESFMKAFIHGHSYTANPLGCAAACASLDLFTEEKTLQRCQKINSWHREFLPLLHSVPLAKNFRIQGTIAAFHICSDEEGYTASIGQKLKALFIENGLLIRPLGNEVYLLPPYCITKEELSGAYQTILDCLNKIPSL